MDALLVGNYIVHEQMNSHYKIKECRYWYPLARKVRGL